MPKQWYNLRADMKNKPAPLLNPGTLEPLKAEELEQIFLTSITIFKKNKKYFEKLLTFQNKSIIL